MLGGSGRRGPGSGCVRWLAGSRWWDAAQNGTPETRKQIIFTVFTLACRAIYPSRLVFVLFLCIIVAEILKNGWEFACQKVTCWISMTLWTVRHKIITCYLQSIYHWHIGGRAGQCSLYGHFFSGFLNGHWALKTSPKAFFTPRWTKTLSVIGCKLVVKVCDFNAQIGQIL